MPGTYKYLASAGDDNVITTEPAVLHKIIVGKDVASSVIKVSDHISTGDANVVIQLEGSALKGVYEVEMVFKAGICADLTNQTNVTFIWSPGGAI